MTAATGNTGYHIVVVGGAAAGCVIAARLSEDGTRRVLQLEARPDHRALTPAQRAMASPGSSGRLIMTRGSSCRWPRRCSAARCSAA